jgi:hypothetical protein
MSESNMQVSAGSIFICYRREDSADVTGRKHCIDIFSNVALLLRVGDEDLHRDA